MAEAKSYNVNVCDASVTFGCALQDYRAYGYLNVTGDIDSN